MTQDMDARKWLAALPDNVTRQRDTLLRLLDAVERDPQWRWLELGCSLAQGRGDPLSDLDVGLGVQDDRWEDARHEVPALLHGLGEVVEALYHRLPAVHDQRHLRAFVQYADGIQVDLVAVPARLPKGRQAEHVMLYDPDGLLAETWPSTVLQPDAETVYEWAFSGWIALSNLAKYLQRRSLWEANESLHEARTQLWRLWAVTKGLRYPGYGLTTVFDHDDAGIPPGIEQTVALLKSDDLLRAARVCAALLGDLSSEAAQAVGGTAPHKFGAFVREGLDCITTTTSCRGGLDEVAG